ncbi:MAG TPA: YggS family pyridoxal phosphate-dependent enzyme, partial [Chloroflexota bacterium]|nr:YggS family pyridoxal phosphate-dependent enzyme [Chloroflexota bacterium]
MTDEPEIARRLAAIHERIRDARDRVGLQSDIMLVAVSKTVPLESIRAAYNSGQRVFGENRVQEGAEKIARARTEMPDSTWHLIGHLQTNKAHPASEAFDVIESVDSLRLAERLNREAERLARRIPVLIEINVAGEESKSGLSAAEFWDAAPGLMALPHLEI